PTSACRRAAASTRGTWSPRCSAARCGSTPPSCAPADGSPTPSPTLRRPRAGRRPPASSSPGTTRCGTSPGRYSASTPTHWTEPASSSGAPTHPTSSASATCPPNGPTGSPRSSARSPARSPCRSSPPSEPGTASTPSHSGCSPGYSGPGPPSRGPTWIWWSPAPGSSRASAVPASRRNRPARSGRRPRRGSTGPSTATMRYATTRAGCCAGRRTSRPRSTSPDGSPRPTCCRPGFTQRMRAFGEAVRLAVPAAGAPVAPAGELIERAQDRLAEVETHRSAERSRVETARMAVRLLRWLATPEGSAPATMLDAVQRQVRDDGWVDRARLDIFVGDVDPQVARAYRLLHAAVEARRARHDHQFAELLQDTTVAERDPGTLLRVEDVLDRVVRPIVDNGRRVLMLVLDGMGTAAAVEIAESLGRGGAWEELTPGGGPRVGVLAALPTVTQVNRCSLFSGRIAVGDRGTELRAFREQFPGGVLLHKSDLRTPAGLAVDPEVAAALGDPAVPLVAAVINTIDDALDRSDPGITEWSTDTVNGLRNLLVLAQDRVVVLVSDHGHVVDRGTEAVLRPADSSENRWRLTTGEPGDGELLFKGSRVALGGGEVILPWREELRYGPRKAGYHGGAAPAEAVIPLLLFAAHDENAVPGWAGAPVSSPEWWREPLRQAAEEAVSHEPAPTESRRPARRAARPPAQDEGLFDLPAPAATAPPSSAPTVPPAPSSPPPADSAATIVKALLASPVYADRRGTRAPLPDERVAAMVATLVAGNGRATLETLATRAGIPVHRVTGTFTVLRRLLQVEGYPVLSLDPDGRTAKLDIALMVEQFGLEVP
ncbi:LOW QUALITY PROTEIN: bacteriophage resistance protein pglZ, partial [Micromonospora sp. ATCC 39149]